MNPIQIISKFRQQISNLSIYFLASLIPMILSLVSNPFLAKNLSPEDYAIIGYYSAFVTLFSPLINFYLLHYYTKRFYALDANGRFLLNTIWTEEELHKKLPAKVKRYLYENNIELYTINAIKIAQDIGLGGYHR